MCVAHLGGVSESWKYACWCTRQVRTCDTCCSAEEHPPSPVPVHGAPACAITLARPLWLRVGEDMLLCTY